MPTQKKKKSGKKIHLQTAKTNIMKGVGRYRRKGNTKLRGQGGYAEDIGSSIGSWLGKKAGSLFKSITGLGTYQVTKNSLMANPNDPPVLSNTRGGTRIQHREFIQDITGSVAFSLTSFPINPGIPQTFPWLSGVATSFEEYILHGLVFEFKSTSATALNSTNTALGTVIQATEYNVVNPVFVAKRDMENYVYSTSCSPDVSALHPVECARDINVLSELFTRSTVPAAGTDLRFTDIGLFQIATVGMQAAAIIGELWVTYDIELIKPKLPNAYTSIGPAHYVYDAAANLPSAGSTAPTSTNFYGTTGSKFKLLGTGNSPVTLDGNIITFIAPGRYLLLHTFVGTGGVTPAWFTRTASSTVTAANICYNASASPTDGATVSATNVMIDMHFVDVSQALSTVPATLTLSGSPFGAEVITGIDFYVFPMPIGFTTRSRTEFEILQEKLMNLESLVKGSINHEIDSDSDWKEPDEVLSRSTIVNAVESLLSSQKNDRFASTHDRVNPKGDSRLLGVGQSLP